MFGWLIMGGAGILGLEIMNYIFYRKTQDYVEKKTLVKYSTQQSPHVWINSHWLNELSNEEIIEWILNTMQFTKASGSVVDLSRSMSETTLNQIRRPSLQEISREKMLKWVSYHMFFKSHKTISEDQISEAKYMLEVIENKLCYIFPETIQDVDDKDLQFLKFGNTEIETSYKPIVVYCAMSTVKNLAYMYLRYMGFTKHIMSKTGIVYFYYKNIKNKGKTTLFIHGLGFGVTPYMSFIKELMETTDVILPILPNISNMEFHGILDSWKDKHMFPDYEDLRLDFHEVLMHNDLYNVNLIGHSFGTIVMSILLRNKNFKQRIGTKIFVDPVCFMEECYKIFNYIKQPDTRNGDLATSIFNSMIYEDVYVRYTVQRYLYGPEYWLLDFDDLLSDAVVVLSAEDKIVPSLALHKKLADSGVACIFVNAAQHADIFSMTRYASVINTIIDHVNHESTS